MAAASPVVDLNHAAAVSMAEGPARALELAPGAAGRAFLERRRAEMQRATP